MITAQVTSNYNYVRFSVTLPHQTAKLFEIKRCAMSRAGADTEQKLDTLGCSVFSCAEPNAFPIQFIFQRRVKIIMCKSKPI